MDRLALGVWLLALGGCVTGPDGMQASAHKRGDAGAGLEPTGGSGDPDPEGDGGATSPGAVEGSGDPSDGKGSAGSSDGGAGNGTSGRGGASDGGREDGGGSTTPATDGDGGSSSADAGPPPDAKPTEPPADDEVLPGVVADPADDAAYIYDQGAVRTYELTIAPADMAMLDANPSAEEYVPGTLTFEGQTYGNLGVRYKGSAGSFIPPCAAGVGGARTGKCSVKVDFAEYDPENRFYGLRKLQFHTMNRDPSMMRERLAYRMFREAGVAAPRSVHARLVINGELVGLFALVEQIDGRFTRSRFLEGGEGNLYKEIWPLHDDPAIYEAALETNEDEDPDVSAFVDFHAAIPQGATALAEFVEWDSILTFLAVDRIVLNDDGPLHFWCSQEGQGNNPNGVGNHNYYWYEVEGGGHFTLIPWDMDTSFAGAEIVHLDPPWYETVDSCECQRGIIVPAACDPFVQEWIGMREDLEPYTDAFLSGPFAPDHVESLLSTWETQIAEYVAEAEGLNSAHSVDAWQAGLVKLREIIASVREHRGYPYGVARLF